jgi:hypothetical protein
MASSQRPSKDELDEREAQARTPQVDMWGKSLAEGGHARLQRWSIEASWQLHDALIKSAADAASLNQQLVTYTRRLERFTVGLFTLTAVLVALTATLVWPHLWAWIVRLLAWVVHR